MPAYRTTRAGALQYLAPGTTTWVTMTMTGYASPFNIRPDWAYYQQSVFVAGQFSRMLRIDPYGSFYPVGLAAPPQAPTLAASGTGITGNAIGYVAFVHKAANGAVLAISNPSPGSSVLALANQGRLWGNLPTVSPDGRATHLWGFVSMDGAMARFAWERELGTSSVTESLPTLSLGDEMESTHGVAGYARIVEVFNERLFWVDPAKPYRLNYSEIGGPEYTTALNFVDTPGREDIIALRKIGSSVLTVKGARVTYALSGFEAADFAFTRISPTVGSVSHHGGVDIGDRELFPSAAGMMLYAGAFVNTMVDDVADEWVADYKANKAAYESAQAVTNHQAGLYFLLIDKGVAPKMDVWVGQYDQRTLGEQGATSITWSHDKMDREITCLGLISSAGSNVPVLIYGGFDGYTRQEDATNGNDDADTYNKAMAWEHGHDFFDDVGPDRNHGKRFTEHVVFLQNEQQAVTVKLYPGGETARDGSPKATKTIPAGASAGKVGRTQYKWRPFIAGQGLTRRYECSAPVGIKYHGDAGAWIDGQGARPAVA